jgi:hypothetical protein
MAAAGSLIADAVLVAAGTRLFPSTTGYAHFRFPDYSVLTVIGVLGACAAWPVVAWLSATPQWLFLRLAVVVTLILWLPDLALLARHQPIRAVLVLMAMHLAVAVVTYQCLVKVAPAAHLPVSDGVATGSDPDRPERRLAGVLAAALVVEFALGIVTLVAVPTDRPSGLVPAAGAAVYLLHAVLGLPLALGALWLVVRVAGAPRLLRLGAWTGATGVVIAGTGGVLTAVHPLRLVGIVLMLLGPVVAGFGYLIPVLDRLEDDGGPPPDR